MEAILNYIENVFSGVPETGETKRLREDMTESMTDKFTELTSKGMSMNEAVGTVIAEFGNIDEVLSEMGIARVKPSGIKTLSRTTLRMRAVIFSALSAAGAALAFYGLSGIAIQYMCSSPLEDTVLSLVVGLIVICAAYAYKARIFSAERLSAATDEEKKLTCLLSAKERRVYTIIKIVLSVLLVLLMWMTALGTIADFNSYYLFPVYDSLRLTLALVCVWTGFNVYMISRREISAKLTDEKTEPFSARKAVYALTLPYLCADTVLFMYYAYLIDGDASTVRMLILIPLISAALYSAVYIAAVIYDDIKAELSRKKSGKI